MFYIPIRRSIYSSQHKVDFWGFTTLLDGFAIGFWGFKPVVDGFSGGLKGLQQPRLSIPLVSEN